MFYTTNLMTLSSRQRGEGLNATYDKEMVKRLDELESLPEDEKQQVFKYMDLVIRDYKTKKAYAHK